MNVTPLVDVVLVLLIIFMVVTPMMEHAARVDLPGILFVDPTNRGKMDPVTVSVTGDGTLFLEQDRVTETDLERYLDEMHDGTPDRRLVVRADRSCRYGDVRRLFAMCRRIGLAGVAVQVGERHDGARASARGRN
jgi:biopolymer transport protein ExbD